MILNTSISKQAKKVIFSQKTVKPIHLQVFFNEVPGEHSIPQKQLGLYLDQKKDFSKTH